jgi:hypothetical protein
MLQWYFVRLRIYSWFMKYLPPPLCLGAWRHHCSISGDVMRTWHLRIWPLITWWDRFNICIVTVGTTHLVPNVHVSIWLKVQLCFKVQAHQSPTFGSAAQQCFFTLGTPAQVGACLKDVDNTFGMAQDILHLGHTLGDQQGCPSQVEAQTDSTLF